MHFYLSRLPIQTMVDVIYTFEGFVAYFDILSVFIQPLLST